VPKTTDEKASDSDESRKEIYKFNINLFFDFVFFILFLPDVGSVRLEACFKSFIVCSIRL
jgi:hypothetical protein